VFAIQRTGQSGGVHKTVLIVDDHAGFRRCARELLTAEGFTVVGEAGDGEEAVRMAAGSSANLVLVDVQLPDTDGFALTERLLSARPDRPVVLVSTRDRSDYVYIYLHNLNNRWAHRHQPSPQ